MLFIENKTLLIQEIDISSLDFAPENGTKIKGILGIIQIYPASYLFVITGHKLVYEVNIPKRVRIYEITDTELIVMSKDGNENMEYKNAIK